MNWQTIGLIVLGILSVAVLATFLLPSERNVTRSKLLEQEPEAVYALVSSSRGFQRFNPFKDDDPNLDIEIFGPDKGVGSGFHFKGKDAEGTQTITQAVPNQRVEMLVDMGSHGKPSQRFTFEESGEQTRVTWSMKMSFGYNPAARIFGLFADSVMGPTFERGLTNLERAASSQG